MSWRGSIIDYFVERVLLHLSITETNFQVRVLTQKNLLYKSSQDFWPTLYMRTDTITYIVSNFYIASSIVNTHLDENVRAGCGGKIPEIAGAWKQYSILENFWIFSDTVRPISCSVQQKFTIKHRKKSKNFPN